MENRRRIGNDYTFTWPFEVRTGEQTTEPYDLTGRVFRLFMVGQLETFEIPADEIEVDGNEITWTWHGKDQRYPGLYNAKLVENGGEDGMITVDVKYAVTLVPHTWQEGGSDDGCISLESVELVATEVSMTPGPRGPQGEQGPAGPQGATGPAGPQGAPGTAGPQGPEGKSAYEVAVENGFEGTEEEWLESLHGGPRGPQGYSAYEVAVNEGYVGTETEWLASLKGETGATGATGPQGPQGVQGATGPQGPTGATGAQGQQGETGPQGPQGETGATGAQGPEGKSAYQVAVDNGYSGTEAQWLASLKGETGATGPQGPKGDTGETGATGPQGETGATGPEGPKGDTGDPGITSASVSVDANTGTPSVDASIANKVLTLAFHNLKGAQGPKGDDGDAGETGPAGERGGKWLEIASTPTAYTTQVGDFLPSYRVSKSAVLTQAGVDDVIVGDILLNSYYVYGVGYVDDDYVYTTARSSIRGATGGTGSAATIAVGTVTTGAAGSSAAVTNRGSSSAAVFDFTIPKGDKGDTGETGATGSAGSNGVGIASVVQTTESTVSGGTNVITITKTDGTTSTVNVRNGDAVGSVTVTQTTGTSTTDTMSQNAITEALDSLELGFSEYSGTDLDITDKDFNVLARFARGHFQTARFDSREALKRTILTPGFITHGMMTTGEYPSNTIEMFRAAAAEYKAKFIEFDCVATSDGKIVGCHNTSATMYLNGTAETVTFANKTLAELKEYTWDAAGNIPITEITELINWVKVKGFCLWIDAKSTVTDAMVKSAYAYAKTIGWEKFIFIDDRWWTDEVCNPAVPVSSAAGVATAVSRKTATNNVLVSFALHTGITDATVQEICAAAKAADILVGAYTANSSYLDACRRYFTYGVDFIIGNNLSNDQI